MHSMHNFTPSLNTQLSTTWPLTNMCILQVAVFTGTNATWTTSPHMPGSRFTLTHHPSIVRH
jgi:hypothetical protein